MQHYTKYQEEAFYSSKSPGWWVRTSKGGLTKVNKSQVYLFKKDQGQNKIVFFYHDAQSPEAFVTKSFSDSASLDIYWDDLLKNW